MISILYIFSNKEVAYHNQLNSEMVTANLRVSYIAIYRMMAVIPLVFFIDLAMFVAVPVYLFIVFRDKLV